MTLNVAIYVFDQVEALDFAGPYEVFTTATRMAARAQPEAQPAFEVFTIGRNRDAVRARAGLKIEPDHTIADHPRIDALIVPGGVVTQELGKRDVIDWIARTAPSTRITASVCTGAFVLAQARLLDGLTVTTHWEDLDDLRRDFPALDVVEGPRWCDAGRLVTSAGISAGIDMSLHLVRRLHSTALAERTARQMDFDWTDRGLLAG
jgi:transcriptional regulator GlxA family with amidase domain